MRPCQYSSSSSGERLLLVIIFISAISQIHCLCDRVYQASSDEQGGNRESGGTPSRGSKMRFEAPIRATTSTHSIWRNTTSGELIMGPHPNASTTRYDAMHCLYKFVASEGERVALSFDSSRMRGNEPDCLDEYVDIYVKFKSDEPIEEAIGREPPNGRFCTANLPHKVVSLYDTVVLSIYSDQQPLENQSMFSGSYEFIKSSQATATRPSILGLLGGSSSSVDNPIGPPEEGTLCSHTIYSSNKREGEFQSITYPGVYVKNLRCSYKFIGQANQRVRLEFLDLDLYSGGGHCPFDSVRVFDGLEETDPLIQLICGSHRSLIIYSTHEHLLVTFTTLQRGAEVLNRGFSAYFEFGDKFFQPNFIQGPNAKHVRGSECDQRIVSTKGSKGTIVSPDSRTNRPNTICRYFFEGLQSSHDYEKVLLKFVEFDLKTSRSVKQQQQVVSTTPISTTTTTTAPTSTGSTGPTLALLVSNLNSSNLMLLNQTLNLSSLTSNDATTSNASNVVQTDLCPDNYVRLYTGEQKPDQRQDPNDYDYVFCGNDVPATIESDAASLLMEYNSGSLGGYFKAEFNFIVDFRISGYQVPQLGCNYVYRSDLTKTGTFNSPRHPSWYINDMNCTFTFLTKPDEALLMQFTTFKMANSFNENVVGHNEACKNEDLVEINEITLDGGSGSGNNSNDTKQVDRYEIGTYCGLTTPGPILSHRPVQINLRTNKEQVNYGFSASYHFYLVSELRTNEFVSNCGEQIHTSHRLKNGTFSSPPTYRSETYEKRNHICSWNITARPGFRIALNFTRFELEGSPPVRGCATAAVRLEYDRLKLAAELCGTLPSTGEPHQFVSRDERLMVTFISTKQASGSNGFTATWLEIKR